MSELDPQSLSAKQDVIPKNYRKTYRVGLLGLAGCGVISAVGLVSWWAYTTYLSGASSAVAVMLVPVEKGDVEITVTESGIVELGGQQTLKAPREATVEQVNVKEGDRVRAGQPLLILRDRQAQDNLKEQQVETTKLFLELRRSQEKVATAQAKLEWDQSGLELTRSQEKIAEVQEKLKTATARYQESQEFFAKGYISANELQTDKERLDTLQSELRDAKLNAAKLEQEVNTRVSTLQTEVQDAQVAQQRAELDLRKSQERLSGLTQQLNDRIVTAPINSLVLKLMVKNGNGVKTETDLITLGDPIKEMVKLQITTLNASKVRINQVARVSMIGPSPKVFTGRVISLSPAAISSTSSNSFGDSSGGQAKVEAKVLLDRSSNVLIPGSLVSVEIVSDRRQQVLVVPPEAVQRPEGKPFVWIKDAQGKAQKRPVTLGLEGLRNVEIQSGLKLGDAIVLAPPTMPLVPGIKLLESPGNGGMPGAAPEQPIPAP
jgi:HlyD family secretion protein